MQFDIKRYNSVTSTMDIARALEERGAAQGTVVVADEQTAGRGRGGHAWFSPPGQALYVSVLLRPALAPNRAGWVSMLAALTVVDTLLELTPIGTHAWAGIRDDVWTVSIKWFNDVLLNHRKVCGILTETSIEGDRLVSVIIGVGLNVDTRFDAAPPDVQARATSLASELGFPLDREDVLSRLLMHLGARYDRLVQTRTSPAAEYARYVEKLGLPVRIDTGSEMINGQALRIEEDGALIVQTTSGERRVGFGEATWPEPLSRRIIANDDRAAG